MLDLTTENKMPHEITPGPWTILKAFWSASWRCAVYQLPFYLPLWMAEGILIETFPIHSSIYMFVTGSIFLFIAMRNLNNINYIQDDLPIRIKIKNDDILYYLLFVSIPYLSVMIPSLLIFGRENELLAFIVGVVPNLIIFWRMMTKGIFGHRMIVTTTA